ncbi:AraC family transcriptional regulator [Chryseobacterium gossypii]|uniref:AraC family transcriptional regulator n=1 Tax=Chryseobacterium gossypii TaxID=3231602 RepID=UPI0035256E5D
MLAMDEFDHVKLYSVDSLLAAPSLLQGFGFYTLRDFAERIRHLKKPHRHDFYSLIIIKSGKGSHTIDSAEYKITDNRIFLITYGQVHTWLQLENAEGYVINFTKSFYNLIYTGNNKIKSDLINISAIPYIDVDENSMEEWLLLADLIHKEYQHIRKECRELICIYLKAALIKYRRDHGAISDAVIHKRDRKLVLIQQFNELVNLRHKQWKLPKQYADALCISPNYLNIIVKRSLGRSAGYIIKDRIILEAKRLLRNTDLTVSEIGNELGFTDKSNFGKYFKKQVGLTPEVYRRQEFNNESKDK